MKTFVFLVGLLLFITACRSLHFPDQPSVDNMPDPVGTIQIAPNLYMDKIEATNFHWLEYLYWKEKTYGKKSPEYMASLPDTNCWIKLDSTYATYVKSYLRHPAYRDYPVVGISYEQAVDFCKWRSDRVFQYMLISKGIIPYQKGYHLDSVFSIEKYFSGNYLNYKPDPTFKVYPVFTLPDEVTFYKFSVFADSLNAENWKKCQRKKCADESLIYSKNCIYDPKDEQEINQHFSDPILPTGCYRCFKVDLIAHLRGNARELTDRKGFFYGNSYMDSCSLPWNQVRGDANLVNAYSGFRCKCVYQVWNK